MKKLLAIILAITLTITLFASCGKPKTALTATELLDLGEKYLLDLDYEQAIVYFNQVIEVEPRNSRAYMGVAEAYIGLDDTESAINILKTALEVFTDDEEVTIDILKMLIEIDPTTAEWYLRLAQIYIDRGDTDKAVEILEDGLNNASDTEDIEAMLDALLPQPTGGYLDNSMLSEPWYFSKFEITEIDFLDSLDNAPENAWDFSLDKDGSVLGWLEGTHLYVAGDGGVIAGEDASLMFGYQALDGYDNLRAINFNDCFDTSNVTEMHRMFYSCDSLTTLDLGCFDTSNVTDMSEMFSFCTSLESVDLSGFDTSNVIYMDYMFSWCSSLTSLDLSSFDTSNVIEMRDMFYDCSSLMSLDISNFDTSNSITLDMFQGTIFE